MSDAIVWHSGVDHFDGNPTATVALDRARWEALGATFVEVDDGDDETPGLAVGEVDGFDFGVLDYGEGETFLLVTDESAAGRKPTRLLDALERASVLDIAQDVVDVADAREGVSSHDLYERLADVEERLAQLETIGASSALYGSFGSSLALRELFRRERREEAGQLQLLILGEEQDDLMWHMKRVVLAGLSRTPLTQLAAPTPTPTDDG